MLNESSVGVVRSDIGVEVGRHAGRGANSDDRCNGRRQLALDPPKDGLDADDLYAVLTKRRSSDAHRKRSQYGKGMWKLEPRELGQLACPVEAF